MKNLTRTGLLLALTLVFQSLRFLIPLPPWMSTFVIGSLVNAALLVALQALGMRSALLIACVTPVVAWLQQLLPLPVFILPVAVGNSLYIWLFSRLRRAGPAWLAVGSAALGKAAFFFLAFRGLLSMLELPPALSTAILFVMGWPQLVTGLVGGFIAIYAWRRLEKI
jgi:hypothetical protein